MADQTLPEPGSFPSLVTFSIVCPKGPLNLAWATHFLAFLRDLPRITTLRVLGWYRSVSFTPGLNGRLQQLHLATRATSEEGPLLEDHVLHLADMCPALQELTIEIKRSRGDAAEVARYRALGRLPRLRRLTLNLDAAPPCIIPDDIVQVASRSQGWKPYYPWPGHTDVEPWFDDGWDSEINKWGLNPHRNGHLRDALVNSAIDSALALSIFGVIDSAKEEIPKSEIYPGMDIQPLERVEIAVTGGARFSQACIINGPAAIWLHSGLTLVRRKWVLERDVRDDSRDKIHVGEVEKDERVQAQAWRLEGQDNPVKDHRFREIWKRVWPTANTDDQAGNWWRKWQSWPLDLRSVEK
ncbi:unnamed protein product [Discula destructiva]